MDISDEIVVLDFGRKLAQGKPRDIQANREVINVYWAKKMLKSTQSRGGLRRS